MSDIILTTINAKYIHSAFGIRSLWCNLGELQDHAEIVEFNINQQIGQITEDLLSKSPKIICFSTFIWNVELISSLIINIRSLAPEIKIIIGGPEASFEYQNTNWFPYVDHVISGEGEIELPKLILSILANNNSAKVINAEPINDLTQIQMPYSAYSDEDIANRVIYVESSRGCPFGCEFCISSLDKTVRFYDVDKFVGEMEELAKRGVKHFKFIDRTFNVGTARAVKILDFFLDNWREGMQLHFEIVPDKLNSTLLNKMKKFPLHGLHLEIGIQSYNPETQDLISRRQDFELTKTNLSSLLTETGALVHTDLVIGLPGETYESFTDGFNQLIAMRPQEIQIGFLKRLKGTPIIRHTDQFELTFEQDSPFEILQTKDISFKQMRDLKRFSRYFDLYYNSENFPEALELLWEVDSDCFNTFSKLSNFTWDKTGQTHKISLKNLMKIFFEFMQELDAVNIDKVFEALSNDFYRIPGRKEKLESILNYC